MGFFGSRPPVRTGAPIWRVYVASSDVSRALRERMGGFGSGLGLLIAGIIVITGYLVLTALVFLPLLGLRRFSRPDGNEGRGDPLDVPAPVA